MGARIPSLNSFNLSKRPSQRPRGARSVRGVHSGLQPGACMLFLMPGSASAHAHAPQPLLTLHMQPNPRRRGARRSAGPAQIELPSLFTSTFIPNARAGAGGWRVIDVFVGCSGSPGVVFRTGDALGGHHDRASCCPASITQPPGPCRLTSPGEYSPPALQRKSPRAAEMDEDAHPHPHTHPPEPEPEPERGERSVAGLLPGLQGAEASALQLRIKNSIW